AVRLRHARTGVRAPAAPRALARDTGARPARVRLGAPVRLRTAPVRGPPGRDPRAPRRAPEHRRDVWADAQSHLSPTGAAGHGVFPARGFPERARRAAAALPAVPVVLAPAAAPPRLVVAQLPLSAAGGGWYAGTPVRHSRNA